ncbi:TM2 domain-containing protein [Deinococcus multiflagellatus]|uniref:TM2 domain-containing protein n=1 Tax=Deinococcus multiflagellatus TaxID=1656887 RepID=A0ABW1ZMK9_9DEIO
MASGRPSPEAIPTPPAPSWVDQAAAPASSAPAPSPAPSWVDDAARGPAPHAGPQPQPAAQPAHHAPASAPYASAPQDDWVTRATGGARNPSVPQGPAPSHAPSRSDFDSLGDSARQLMQGFSQGAASGDVAQKKLIAGLLGIFLGGLGVHKFYLGNTTPGLLMLGATIGGWILGIIGSLVIVGAVFFFVPMIVGLLGLVEGIIYLTKSDADFQREYLMGKKPWL